MKKYLSLFLMCLILIAGPAWSATYYMRGDGTAGDKSAATGCGAASTAMAEDVLGWGGDVYSPGDIIYLCDNGGAFTQLIVPSAGITIESAPGHSASVVEATENMAVYISAKDNITLRNFTAKCTKMTETYNSAIYVTNSDGLIIDNVEAKESANGIWIAGDSANGIIQNSYVHDNSYPADPTEFMNAGIELTGTVSNFVVINNRILNNGNTATIAGLNAGAGVRVETTGSGIEITDNTITGNGQPNGEDGSQIEAIAAQGMIVQRNYMSGAPCGEIKRNANGLIFRNNICISPGSGCLMYGYEDPSESTGAKIYNNTFISTRAAGSTPDYALIVNINSPSAGEIYNNLLIHTGTMAASKVIAFELSRMTQGATDIATFDNKFDYNLAYGMDKWVQVEDDGAYTNYTLTEYKATYANQNQNSKNTNPLLRADYSIPDNSPAATGGDPQLTYAQWIAAGGDFAGRNPTNGGFSIGAYQAQFKKSSIVPLKFGKSTKASKPTDTGSYVP
jgi:hypothetical protein